MILPYDASKEERDRVTAERQAKMYEAFEKMRKKIDDRTSTMNMSTVSEKVQRQQLEEIRYEIQKELGSFYSDLETGLKSDMEKVGQSVLSESEGFYKALNMPIAMKITSFPVEVMNNIVNGSVYEQKWYLSNALWGDYHEKLDDINEVITEGIGLNLSTYEIAKNLEQYVDPSARKEWAWSKVYPGTAKKVDYNAQRLARTLINHAYQQNVVQHAKANPFSKGVKWLASGGERMCPICEDRDGKIYDPDEVPLDHPNGMCAFEVVVGDLMEISNVLADFVNGVPTEYDDKLYEWYNDRAVNPEQKPNAVKNVHVVVEGSDISSTWQRRSDQFDFEIEDIINAQGFDGLPQVVSAEEFEKFANESNIIAQRGYKAKDEETLSAYQNELYNGKWYVDCSRGGAAYGRGMYAVYEDGVSPSEDMIHTANLYGGNGVNGIVETFTMDKNSKFISYDEARGLEREYNNWWRKEGKKSAMENAAERLSNSLGLRGNEKDYMKIGFFDLKLDKETENKVFEWFDKLSDSQKDEIDGRIADEAIKVWKGINDTRLGVGEIAVLHGYDGIKVEQEGYLVVLNRTKMIINGGA